MLHQPLLQLTKACWTGGKACASVCISLATIPFSNDHNAMVQFPLVIVALMGQSQGN